MYIPPNSRKIIGSTNALAGDLVAPQAEIGVRRKDKQFVGA